MSQTQVKPNIYELLSKFGRINSKFLVEFKLKSNRFGSITLIGRRLYKELCSIF